MTDPLLPLDQARDFVLSGCERLPVVALTLAQALGTVIARPVRATEPVPPFANTAMDGYAVRAVDTVGADREPVTLAVVGTLAAGAAPDVEVGPGQAVRIMTGAPMPLGADAVVMVELTGPAPGSPGSPAVVVRHQADPGEHVRAAGDDVATGEEVLPAGTVLGPGHLGVLASLGQDTVSVFRRARVGVISTGDELVQGSVPLAPGQIRDSNRPTLMALLDQAGCAAVDLGTARDTEADITAALERGLATCDALVTSGGVSVGDFDYTKAVLDRLSGGTMRWMQVAIRPAKPLAFGVVKGVPVFGLPGNPVSSVVSFECFARPALRQMMGHPAIHRPTVQAVADAGLPRRPDGKLHLDRVVAEPGADGRYHVRSSGGQASHQLLATARANALALVRDGEGVPAGGTVPTMLLGP
ncbi:MAG: molybdopterin molybdotransferase MoeA [Acidimicrobiales bacterium]